MRVMLVNVHYAPDSFGGATVIAQEMASRLSAAGHEVLIVTTTADGDLEPGQLYRYEVGGIPVVAIRKWEVADPAEEFDSPRMSARFAQILRMTRPDVVHFHALQTLGVGCVAEAQSAGIATVVTLHDAWWLCERQFMVRSNGHYCGQSAISAEVCATCVPFPERHEARQAHSREILSRCSRVLTPSRFWADVMSASGVPAAKTFVNANGVARPGPSFRRGRRPGPLRLGYVGGLSPVKGYRTLVEALQGIRRSDYELIVVDSFTNLGIQTMTPADWPVPGLVRVVPAYNAETVDEFFGSIDALLFPSQWRESYGLTVREAVLRGVWPILTDGGGTQEAIVAGVNGTLVPRSGGAAALGAAVSQYLDASEAPVPDADVAAHIPTFEEQAADLIEHLEQAVEHARSPWAAPSEAIALNGQSVSVPNR